MNAETKHSGPVDVRRVMARSAHQHWEHGDNADAEDAEAALAAVAELIEADREYDTARFEWQHSDRYECDSYGIHGSEFYICLACEKQSGAGILNKGITHETDCKVAALERAEARRAAALANTRSAS